VAALPGNECPRRRSLEQLPQAIDQCQQRQGCGYPPCGAHAIGKPTHQPAVGSPILVVGEAPAADGWWVTGRAFYRKNAAGGLVLSRTGANLNDCLTVLGTVIENVGFIEAVRCRPSQPGSWHPPETVRRHCRSFLENHLLITEPSLVLPLGLVATASCIEVAFGERPSTLEAVVGTALEWSATWGICWIIPLYHPSPVNGARWRRNKLYLKRFLRRHSSLTFLPLPQGRN
jgi:uracil-DNA glycosylase family 4